MALSNSRLLELLAECAAKMLAASDPRQMIDYLFDRVRAELGIDVYFHYLATGDGMLVLEGSGGLTPEQEALGRQLAFGQAVCGCVARDREPRLVENVLASDDPMTEFIRMVGLDSYACTPLVHGETLIGTLGFGRRGPVPFTPSELQFLRTICSYVAVARNRLDVQAEMMATLQAHESLAAEQARLIERLSADAAGADVALIAHEIVQPLSAATNYLTIVQQALKGLGGAGVMGQLSRARSEIGRCAQIVARMRKLLRSGEINAEFVVVRQLLDDAVELVVAARGSAVPGLQVEVGAGVADILGDRVQLVQVIANLIRNSADAVRDTAAPSIRVSAATVGDFVEIAVADNGPGFADGVLPVPGRSTTGGSGIGLSVARQIIEAHDAELVLAKREAGEAGGARLSFRLVSRAALAVANGGTLSPTPA